MKFGHKTGMTFPEVLIACAILGVTLSAFIVGFTASEKTVAYANNRLTALHSARQQMENFFSLKYGSPGLSVGTHALSNGNYVVTENNGVKTITLTITWIDPTRRAPSTVTLVSSMAYAIHK